MHHVPQAQARAQLQVARFERPFDQQDGAAPAQLAHALGLGQVEQRKTVGTAQGVKHPLDTVAVSIGFDDCPQFGIWYGLAHPLEVVTQSVGMDGGKNGTRHGFEAIGRWEFWHSWAWAACYNQRLPAFVSTITPAKALLMPVPAIP
ncbi:hypothetical protein D3C78_1587210 [compost metagenome]